MISLQLRKCAYSIYHHANIYIQNKVVQSPCMITVHMMNAFLSGLISMRRKLEKIIWLKKPDFCARKNLYDEWKIKVRLNNPEKAIKSDCLKGAHKGCQA